MAVTAKDITELRQRTQAGMLDCKNALEANNGDMDKSAEWLREKGMASAAKKEGRIAAEGKVESYIHLGGKIGVLVEVNCETDFVAKSQAFGEFVHNVALQIAASRPLCVSEADADKETLEAERKVITALTLNEGKPPQVAAKIVEGRMKKYLQEICLLGQVYFRDTSKTIDQYLKETIGTIGEKITIRRFVRYEMGEGLQKKNENFAEEIQKQIDKQKAKA